MAQAVYVGDDDGYILCTLVPAENLQRVPSAAAVNALATVNALRPRTGAKGVLYWTEHTTVSLHLENVHQDVPPEFPYHVSVSTDFAALSLVQETMVGEHIALAFKACAVETRETNGSQLFLEVHGIDIEGATTGPHSVLEVWRGRRFFFRACIPRERPESVAGATVGLRFR